MDNKQIAESFRLIRKLLKQQGEDNQFRLRAYDRAADQIVLMDLQLVDVWVSAMADGPEKALRAYCKKFQSVGEKSQAKIIQLLQTGTCDELEQLKAAAPVTQDEMFAPEELAPTKKRKASANLREEVTATRRPRTQAQEVVDRVRPVIEKYFELVEICGSWRRNKPDVKDLDFAASQIRAEWAHEPVSLLFTRIEKDLHVLEQDVVKRGEAQTAFYAHSASGDWHVDIWYVPAESWGSAILFATGSAEFNIEMRGWLKGRGYSLSRYGLFRTKEGGRELIASKTEEEIFQAIGLAWVPPPERIHFDPSRKS